MSAESLDTIVQDYKQAVHIALGDARTAKNTLEVFVSLGYAKGILTASSVRRNALEFLVQRGQHPSFGINRPDPLGLEEGLYLRELGKLARSNRLSDAGIYFVKANHAFRKVAAFEEPDSLNWHIAKAFTIVGQVDTGTNGFKLDDLWDHYLALCHTDIKRMHKDKELREYIGEAGSALRLAQARGVNKLARQTLLYSKDLLARRPFINRHLLQELDI